ncbi:CPBP family intramembrane metalloprotease [Stenotrophomonas maltophilia]|uniref:CPBP family intramembrane glutamic endopeptidase n=1 Tax=Stenotrophomonas maltophilia TaxID=40324 RepID=UPI002036AF84|nr:type II CAAX endopeptidase family protein [Stenotrophomonas maltophilia]MCM2519825.1 CPBP family intramembrane metalloprotease [Stenotrophomonas maltophilia]
MLQISDSWPEAQTTRPFWKLFILCLATAAAICAAVLIFIVGIAVAKVFGLPFPSPTILEVAHPGLENEHVLLGTVGFAFFLTGLAVLVPATLVYRTSACSMLFPSRRDWLFYGVWGALMTLVAYIIVSMFLPGGQGLEATPLAEAIRGGFGGRYLLANIVFLFVMAATEEVVCRGVFLHITRTFFRSPAVLCVANGLFFSLLHAEFDPVVFLARFVSGAFWTWCTLRSGSIAFAVASHWMGNLFIALSQSPIYESAESGTVQDLLAALSVEAIVLGLFVLLMRRSDLVRLLGRGIKPNSPSGGR